ncbi:helix-turn-helix transcriptional regulator [Neomesorhizobium albiziae]|uniref:helix-turn-helix transcriptional regulator n=1 Tax=Neomesorhizobium albiziae TaxID=335020 RepID=UPI00122D0F83|nr:hypothetical protein [Mesorhizobium albiziae]
MSRALNVLPPSLPPVGINREQAATFIGVSPTTFDEMVQDGRMPQPRMPSKGRIVWDVEELVLAFRKLPHRQVEEAPNLDEDLLPDNPWDRKPRK